MPHGSFCWNELNTHHVDAAKRFYGAALGWEFEAMPMPDFTYWVAKVGGSNVGGIFPMSGPDFEGVPEHWLSYVAVDDIDSRVKKAAAHGGKVMREPFDVPGVGRIAILKDPNGAMLAWMTPNPQQP